jgi:hypothetical protein
MELLHSVRAGPLWASGLVVWWYISYPNASLTDSSDYVETFCTGPAKEVNGGYRRERQVVQEL